MNDGLTVKGFAKVTELVIGVLLVVMVELGFIGRVQLYDSGLTPLGSKLLLPFRLTARHTGTV